MKSPKGPGPWRASRQEVSITFEDKSTECVSSQEKKVNDSSVPPTAEVVTVGKYWKARKGGKHKSCINANKHTNKETPMLFFMSSSQSWLSGQSPSQLGDSLFYPRERERKATDNMGSSSRTSQSSLTSPNQRSVSRQDHSRHKVLSLILMPRF